MINGQEETMIVDILGIKSVPIKLCYNNLQTSLAGDETSQQLDYSIVS